VPKVREVSGSPEADGALVRRFGSESSAPKGREGEAQTGGTRSLAQARKLLRQFRADIVAVLECEISKRNLTVDPAAIFEAIVSELAGTIVSGVVDEDRIGRIAALHDELGVTLDAVARIYRILEEKFFSQLSADEASALARHQSLLIESLSTNLEIRLTRAESLHRLLVQFVARLEDWTEGDESSFLDQVTALVAQETGARLVVVAEARGSLELGFANEPLRVRSVCGPSADYLQEVTLWVGEEEIGGRGPIGAALRTGKVQSDAWTAFLSRVPEDERPIVVDRFERYGIGSMIATPFVISGTVTGVLAIYGGLRDPLPDDVTGVVAGLGSEISKVFEMRASRHHEELHRTIHDVELLIANSSETDCMHLVDQVMKELVERRLVSHVMVLVPNEDGSSLVPMGTYGTSSEIASSLEGVAFDLSRHENDGLGIIRVFREGVPVVTVGLQLTEVFADVLSPDVMDLVEKTVIARLPVVVGGQSLGVVTVSVDGRSMRDLDARGIEFVNNFIDASKARVAHNREVVESAWLSQIYRALLPRATTMIGAQSSDDLFRELCSALVSEGFFSGAWVAVPDYGRNRLVSAAAAGMGTEWLSEVVIPLDYPGLGPNALRAFREDAAFAGQNELADPEVAPWLENLRSGGWGSVGAVPLHRRGRVMGSLILTSRYAYAFSAATMTLIETVAQMVDQVLFSMDLRDDLDEERIRQHYAARTDYLTEIPNRGAFEEAVETALRTRGERFVAIGIVDLDGFKDYNDSFGSRAGDALLKLVGRRLVESVGEGEFVARLGGDEFGICSTVVTASAMSRVARKIESSMAAVRAAPNVSFSAGWAVAPFDGGHFEPLHSRADQALRAAKESGRGRHYVFGGKVARESELRREVRTLVPRAIAEGSLEFACQPKIDARTGTIVGIEMLLRWDRLPLDAVIAETRRDPGLARALGKFVISSALEIRRSLDGKGLARVDVSINISPSHFQSNAFLSDTRPLWELAGGRVIVEVTEDAALDDLANAAKTIQGLHEHGLALSLDDFGTGYASLSNIAGLNVDEIKVDRSFLTAFSLDQNSFAVVNSLIMLGELSGAAVIGEGIETEEQLHLWLRLGGRYVQGYCYARPMPLADVISFAKDSPCVARTDAHFPIEDLPLVAYLQGIGSGDLGAIGRLRQLDAWFQRSGNRWGGLSHFQEALSLHSWLHSDEGLRMIHGSKREECQARFAEVLGVLEQEIEEALDSPTNPRR